MHSVLPCSVILCPREFEGFAGKALVGKSGFLGLAFGLEVMLLETAKSRGNRVTRKRGAIQDVEAIGMSSTDGSEKEPALWNNFTSGMTL